MNDKKLYLKSFWLIFIISLFGFSFKFAISKEVYVRGYFRSNGTYVPPHFRTSPDGIPWNNYSFPGNFNPNTGAITPGDPYKYLEIYNSKKKEILDLYIPLLGVSVKNISQSNSKSIENSFQPFFSYFYKSKRVDDSKNFNKIIQKALKSLGYDLGPIDGIMGIKTKLAIRLFQKDNGLIPTGVVGNLTIDVMCDKLVGNSKIKIIDGDTFLWEGEKIRIYGYDAPEMNEPGYELAKIKLALFLSSGVVTIERLAKDKYNRTVARVKVNQRDIAELFKEL